MQFFQRQDNARQRTRWLIVLFIIALVVTSILLYGGVAMLTNLNQGWWDWVLFRNIAIITTLVIGAGSFLKVRELATDGGVTIADTLDGREVESDTIVIDERQLLHIVEEMALASGIPAPSVFILDREDGINAFAAGNTPDDAVIGVTRGSLKKLTRDELQALVAHEFSHILNGDIRLNLLIIGVLHGLGYIARAGKVIIKAGHAHEGIFSMHGIFMFGGIALYGLGGASLGLATLIRMAILRQRTHLADAAAIEFTRHPEALSQALKKIGGYTLGSGMISAHAEEAGHMMFAAPVAPEFLFIPSHPPLRERILTIEPHWDGTWIKPTRPTSV